MLASRIPQKDDFSDDEATVRCEAPLGVFDEVTRDILTLARASRGADGGRVPELEHFEEALTPFFAADDASRVEARRPRVLVMCPTVLDGPPLASALSADLVDNPSQVVPWLLSHSKDERCILVVDCRGAPGGTVVMLDWLTALGRDLAIVLWGAPPATRGSGRREQVTWLSCREETAPSEVCLLVQSMAAAG